MAFKATTTNGLWMLPSKGRPDSLARFFNHYKETGATTAGAVLLDKADHALHEKAYSELDLPWNWLLIPVEGAKNLGDTMRWAAQQTMHRNAEWIGMLCDDQVPITQEWDLKTIEPLNGKNFVSGNDEWQSNRLVGAIAWSRELLDIVGMFPANFKHQFSDNIWETIGRDFKCWVILKDCIVHHLHHLSGKAVRDERYRITDGFMPSDAVAWTQWLMREYATIKRKVLEFQQREGG